MESTLPPFAISVLRCLRSHVRSQAGELQISIEGVNALLLLGDLKTSPDTFARQARAHACIDADGWYYFSVVPFALRKFKIATNCLDFTKIEETLEQSLIVCVESESEPEASVEAAVSLAPADLCSESSPSEAEPECGVDASSSQGVVEPKVAKATSISKDSRRIKRLKQQVQDLKQKAKRADELLDMRSHFFHGPKLRYLSVLGGFSIVMRRIVSGVGARACAAMLQIDLYRTTINRWELIFHTCCVQAWQTWYASMYQLMFRVPEPNTEVR